MAAKAKAKKEQVIIYTPIGLLAWPHLHAPDTGREYSDNKYKGDLFIPKPVWAKEGKEVVAGIIKVAAKFFDNPKIKLSDFKHPIVDMDKEKNVEDYAKGTIRIRAKSLYQPTIIGARKDENGQFPKLSEEEIKDIKAGDFGRFICNVYGYSQQGGGIALGLNFFQFGYKGAAIGQGNLAQIKNLSEIEVEVDTPEDMVDTENEDEKDADPMMDFA